MKGISGCSLERSGALETFKAKETAQAGGRHVSTHTEFSSEVIEQVKWKESHHVSLKPLSLSAAKFSLKRRKQFKLRLMDNSKER